MNLRNLIEEKVEFVIFNGQIYYNLYSFNKLLHKGKNIILENENIILLPFYIDNMIYEIYDYELLIEKSTKSTRQYILEKTGKKDFKSINTDIINKLSMCYISSESSVINIDKLLKYVEYVLYNIELSKRIKNLFGSVIIEKLYFEIY